MIAVTYVASLNLECEFIRSEWFDVGELDNCYARNIEVRDPLVKVDSINGNGSQVLSYVKGFWIEKEVVEFLPESLGKFLPSLLAFGMDNTGLKRLSKLNLQPFTAIQRFAFYRGELEYLESDLFTYNKNLQSISLTDNNMLIIGHSIFDHLPQLYSVQVKLRCIDVSCENKKCLPEVQMKLKKYCQSDDVIKSLKETFCKL